MQINVVDVGRRTVRVGEGERHRATGLNTRVL